MTQSNPEDAFKDSLNFVKKLWGGVGVPGMSMPSMPTIQGMAIPTVSLEELDKRITELKSVESWLNMNVGMLHNTIQALEIQRGTVATLHALSSTMAQTMQANAHADDNADGKKEDASSDAAPDVSPGVSPLLNQSAAWWNAVQEQFKQALNTALEKSASNDEAGSERTTKAAQKTKASSKKTNAKAPARKSTSPSKTRKPE